ncbi:MAG: YIP1 family protein [Anaerocolumna sp.]
MKKMNLAGFLCMGSMLKTAIIDRFSGKGLKRVCHTALAVTMVGFLASPALGYADTPYKTFTQDGYGRIIETQTAYTPVATITKVGDFSFTNASDMVITNEDEIYIADTKGKRILVSDTEGNLLRTYGEDILKGPTGLFVTSDKKLYVADKDAGKVVVFNQEGEVILEYTKPDHPLYGKDMSFKPQKIAVDAKGTMYIICEGNTNGIVQISPTDGGTFLGYFGTNMTSVNLIDVFRRVVLTDEQLAKLPKILPPTPNNLTIDEKGLIYTTTQGEGYNSLKKLNVAGKNMIESDAYDELPSAVTVGNYENIYMTSDDGYIYECNKDGSLLFIFGGKDAGRLRIGLFQKPVAIDVDQNNRIYVLDQEKNEIQVFEPTEFTDLVHQALYLYQDGKYTKSKEPLVEVLKMNSLFDYANMAMGQAYLQEEEYDTSLTYFRMAKDYQGFSDAFWEVRNLWIKENLITGLGILIAIYAAFKVTGLLKRKNKIPAVVTKGVSGVFHVPLIQKVNYMGFYIKHPIDGCYGIKRERKTSYFSANILFILFILIYLVDRYASGFLFKNVADGNYDIFTDVVYILGVFTLMTVCTYLVCTINDGEGTFKQIYCSFIYSLGPYILLKPFIVVLSNVVTINEKFLIEFSNFCLYAWIIVLLFMSIKEINNYSVMETVKIILLTFFCALIAVLLLFILYVLVSQVVDYVQALYGEVVYRLE